MVNFLDKIIKILPQAQTTAIRSIVAQKSSAGFLTSIRARQEDARKIYRRIRGKLGGIILSPQYGSLGEKIDSESFNQNMEEIFLDLNSLYTSVYNSDKRYKANSVILNSEYIKSRSAIEKLINDVKVYSLQKLNPDFNEVKLFDFNSSSNVTSKRPAAVVSPDVRLLQSKPLTKTRVHLPDRVNRNTKIYTKTYSKGDKSNLSLSFPVENMVDQKLETFWGTSILADGPISQVYEKGTTSGSNVSVGVDGPVIEIYLNFSHAERINNIKVLPFGDFPLKILDVGYKPVASAQVFSPILLQLVDFYCANISL